MSPLIGKTLGQSHHRVDHIVTGRQLQMGLYGTWLNPPLVELMAEADLQELETYISRHKNKVSQHITTMPIMDLCLMVERLPVQGCINGGGSRRSRT